MPWNLCSRYNIIALQAGHQYSCPHLKTCLQHRWYDSNNNIITFISVCSSFCWDYTPINSGCYSSSPWYERNIYFIYERGCGKFCWQIAGLLYPCTPLLHSLAWFLGTANISRTGSKVTGQSCCCVTNSNGGTSKTQVSQTNHPYNTCTSGCQQGHD